MKMHARKKFPIRNTFFLLLLLSVAVLAETTAPTTKTGNFGRSPATVGGVVTDGKDVSRIRWAQHPDYERVVIDIMSRDPYDPKAVGTPTSRASRFEVKLVDSDTLRFYFWGTRRFSAGFPRLTGPDHLIESFERYVVEDDSCTAMDVRLAPGCEWEIFELKNPGRIVLDVRR